MTRGEVSQERKDEAEKLGLEFERLRQLTEQMSEAMGEDMVELPKLETEKDEEDEQVRQLNNIRFTKTVTTTLGRKTSINH